VIEFNNSFAFSGQYRRTEMVKVGIIGAGFMGAMHYEVYKHIPNAEIIAIADVDQEKCREIVSGKEVILYSKGEELISDERVEMVDICLPTSLHKECVVQAAKAKKDVLCEKPIALNTEDAHQMLRIAREYGVKFMVAHCVRFWPEYKVLKRLVEEGSMGQLQFLNMRRLSPAPQWSSDGWMLKPELCGGALIDLHIHDTDFVLYLLGKPVSIYSQGLKTERGWEHISSIFQYEQGVKVYLEASWRVPDSFPFTAYFMASFEKGVLELNPHTSPALKLYQQNGVVETPQVEELAASTDTEGNISELGGYFNEIKYFVDCIEKNELPTVVTPEEAKDSLELVLKEMESAEKGEAIKI